MAAIRNRNVRIVSHASAEYTYDWRDRMAAKAIGRVESLSDSELEQAACTGADTELFYDGRTQLEAKRICFACPVVRRCLIVAMINGDSFAVLGGTTPAERVNIRRQVLRKRQGRGTGAAA